MTTYIARLPFSIDVHSFSRRIPYEFEDKLYGVFDATIVWHEIIESTSSQPMAGADHEMMGKQSGWIGSLLDDAMASALALAEEYRPSPPERGIYWYALFSNGLEGMGERSLGLFAHFLDKNNQKLHTVHSNATVSDPLWVKGAKEEHRHGKLLDNSIASRTAGIAVAWYRGYPMVEPPNPIPLVTVGF